ncbi:cupin domain-containing protein [uncultured Shewanella sp.]|uniref:cupin domain-containing protein n=1 Tax=uncultured Shewanella sp. TaxID=173975 RepID=UPI00261AE1E3|nr:cupin domain-containing protein [uncultured Shewanella sp.]
MRTVFIILSSFIYLFFINHHFALAETKETHPSTAENHHESNIKVINQSDYADLLIKTDKSWDGALLPDYSTKEPQITVIRLTIPPKSQLPIHQHPSITVAYLLKGEFTAILEDNSKKIELKAGKVEVEVVNTWHYGINYSDDPAELLIVYIGSKNVPLTINKYNDIQ